MPEDESDEEWRFSVDEFEDSSHAADSSTRRNAGVERVSADAAPVDDGDESDEGDNVAGEFAPNVPVVPETPSLENAAFVTLGVILTILAGLSVVRGASFGLTDVLLVVAVVGGIGLLAYGAFVHLTPDT